jgi:hypothetical protein
VQSFLPSSGLNSTLLALGPAFVIKQPHLTCPRPLSHTTSFVSSRSFARCSTNNSPSVTPYSHCPPSLTRNMKIKKLTAIMAAVPFGAATVLTATGTAPYYGNASILGTAVINPYAYTFHCSYLFCPLASLPFHHTSHQHLASKEPMSAIPSAHVILTRVLERWTHLWTPQQTTTPQNSTHSLSSSYRKNVIPTGPHLQSVSSR